MAIAGVGATEVVKLKPVGAVVALKAVGAGEFDKLSLRPVGVSVRLKAVGAGEFVKVAKAEGEPVLVGVNDVAFLVGVSVGASVAIVDGFLVFKSGTDVSEPIGTAVLPTGSSVIDSLDGSKVSDAWDGVLTGVVVIPSGIGISVLGSWVGSTTKGASVGAKIDIGTTVGSLDVGANVAPSGIGIIVEGGTTNGAGDPRAGATVVGTYINGETVGTPRRSIGLAVVGAAVTGPSVASDGTGTVDIGDESGANVSGARVVSFWIGANVTGGDILGDPVLCAVGVYVAMLVRSFGGWSCLSSMRF